MKLNFFSVDVIHSDIRSEPALNASTETSTDELRTDLHNGLNELSHIVGGMIFSFVIFLSLYVYYFILVVVNL